MLSKATLRQAFRTNLDRVSSQPGHDQGQFAESSIALSKRLAEYLLTQTGVWAAFEPMGFEPDIRSAIASSSHIRWAYPRIEPESTTTTTLSFYEVASRDELVKNQWGIWEPDPTRANRVKPSEFHGLLIPGLAFDEKGNRLGRGKGYYDRALSGLSQQTGAVAGHAANQPLKIGIAFERQIAQQELPQDPHDIAMDLVVTESRILVVTESRILKGTSS